MSLQINDDTLSRELQRLNQENKNLAQEIKKLNDDITNKNNQLSNILSSTCWRLTSPWRSAGTSLKWLFDSLRILPGVIRRGGGIGNSFCKLNRILRLEGLSGVKHRLQASTSQSATLALSNGQLINRHDYTEWVRSYDTLDSNKRAQIKASIEVMPYQPTFSIVMPTFDPPLPFLDEAIWSVRNQLYPHWELCIADDASKSDAVRKLLEQHAAEDPRIRVVFRSVNGHISAASNSALEIATGVFIVLMDNDDKLSEDALYWVAETTNQHPDAALIYSDEDKLSELDGIRIDPYFKSDWNPDLFLSHNLITHLGVYRLDIIRAIGGFRLGFEGAQDYDLAARFVEQIKPSQIIHIPKILYHWRILTGSTAKDIGSKPYAIIAGKKTVNEHLSRRGIKGHVSDLAVGHRVHFALPDNLPLVSIIIPTRNALKYVQTCVSSIYKLTTYPNFEIILIDNGSDDHNCLDYFQSLENNHDNFHVIRDEQPFNFSALNNLAVNQSHGDIVVFLNNDIEVISPDWLNEMVSIASLPRTGAVGAKLLYPDDTIQHAGVILGIGGWAGHAHKGFPAASYGYVARAALLQNFSAVTGACLAVSREKFLAAGGFNETDLAIACNDVDLCLKLKTQGYNNVWTPFACLYHHESATRGYEDTPEKKSRFAAEVTYMHTHWGNLLANDPAYNPNLTLDHEDFSLAWPPRTPSL